GTRPTDDLLIHLPTAGLAQRIQLQGQVLVMGTDPGIADLHSTPSELDILVAFSCTKRNQFFEQKDARQLSKNQEGLPRTKIVRQNGGFSRHHGRLGIPNFIWY